MTFGGVNGMPTRDEEGLVLVSLLSDEVTLAQWGRVCSAQALQDLQDRFGRLRVLEPDLGRAVERAVIKYGAVRIAHPPHVHVCAYVCCVRVNSKYSYALSILLAPLPSHY
jgi:hypothetical protein